MRIHWPLVSLCGLFLASFLGALAVLTILPRDRLPQSNHGVLLARPVVMDGVSVMDGRWQVVYFTSAGCDATCIETQGSLAKLYDILSADRHRFRVVQTTVASHDMQKWGAMIVDPRGLGIMGYPHGFAAHHVLQDLTRLLKYSHEHT